MLLLLLKQRVHRKRFVYLIKLSPSWGLQGLKPVCSQNTLLLTMQPVDKLWDTCTSNTGKQVWVSVSKLKDRRKRWIFMLSRSIESPSGSRAPRTGSDSDLNVSLCVSFSLSFLDSIIHVQCVCCWLMLIIFSSAHRLYKKQQSHEGRCLLVYAFFVSAS